ncbi:plasmid stabilization protein [Nocardia sp. NPDC049190]|uniref:plasmid stabilization protein n=1 Tax=Nocardia sp. NPDC049190 TaxID=3155650 RepID=UPI0033F30762
MPKEWTDKQERQYQHIEASAETRGESVRRAKEIAARTVNKNRAQAGQTETASKTSLDDMSPQKRGGQRSHRGSTGPTRDQLYSEAKKRGIKGRSTMSKKQLADALGRS